MEPMKLLSAQPVVEAAGAAARFVFDPVPETVQVTSGPAPIGRTAVPAGVMAGAPAVSFVASTGATQAAPAHRLFGIPGDTP
jgi:hypothetical protein